MSARVYEDVYNAICELSAANGSFRPVRLMAIGCSTSEIAGGRIGRASAPEIGGECARACMDAARERGIQLAFQCCEHLNRALVVERETAEKFGLEIVSAVPHPSAGGSCASAAYRLMGDPVLVESAAADAGIDIGQTLIGMHIRAVAVPVRLSITSIGGAIVTCCRSRPRLIGGERARYAL